ncbi:hypothetical protein HYPSUDRAFT_53788 [Hypholoma sublateritium FD-334 SS-4]|uniref:Uncharacterized protein n=1 Tax=Hypholoma sublateritium (strain FD-334 SS-4) TaxID=945553 RepID=A0A0D2PYH8_HYPSF|nr:hypothetical protein HYPSUDRAFT_53788 [Hypholoma sublateritium FD-334 SS-4]
MSGAEFGAAAIGGGFALAAAGYQAISGFAARHEAVNFQQVEATKRYIAEFEEAHRRGEVSKDDWMRFRTICETARDAEKVYEDSIEEYKETTMLNPFKKLNIKRKVRKCKKALKQSNRLLRLHHDLLCSVPGLYMAVKGHIY